MQSFVYFVVFCVLVGLFVVYWSLLLSVSLQIWPLFKVGFEVVLMEPQTDFFRNQS